MKRRNLYISIIAFILVLTVIIIIFTLHSKKYDSEISGKTNNKSIFEDYDFSENIDNTSYMYLTENRDNFFVVTDYSIYKNIYKVSKKTGRAEILCNNPQCTHTDDTCSAYLGINVDGLWIDYYNDRLYYTEKHDIADELRFENWIMSMDLEGKDRKKEVKINDSVYNSESGYAISMKLYGKEVYLTKTYTEPDEMGVLHSLRAEIYKIDLDVKEMEKIYEKSYFRIYAEVCAKEDNNVYMYVELPDENDEFKYNGSTIIYDTDTGSITEEYNGIYYITGVSGDNRFYTTPYEDESKIFVKKAGSKEYVEIYNMGTEGAECDVAIYNDYIIINNWSVRNREKEDKCITILDTDGNFIKEINTYGYTSDTKIANGFLFTEKLNEDEKYDIYICPIETDTDTWTKIN